jgi:hypothetical protein
MKKLSTGHDSTLRSYRDMSSAVFGEDSKPVRFFEEKAAVSPNGLDEEVVAPESQMMLLILSMI